MKRKKRKCRNCGRLFIPDRYNYRHKHYQQYCSDGACCKASKKASDKKYRRKMAISLEYRLKESKRVQEYQSKHPNYKKKRKKVAKKIPEREDLRDFVPVEKLQEDMSVLRDIAIWQGTVFKGLVSYLTDDVLRDDIGLKCNRLYDRGMEVSGMAPGTDILSKIINMKVHNETQSTNRTPA